MAFIMLVISACGHGTIDDADITTDDSDSVTFHIAVLPIEECNPLYTAQQHGMFDSLGLVVKLDTFASAMDADTAFMNGKAHMIISDSIKMAYLNTLSGTDTIRSVITDTLHLYMMTTRQSRIKTTKSLREKIVAVTRNSALDYFANNVMTAAKHKPEELNRPQINDISLRTNMLLLNQYDGAILPEPYATQCEEQGANRIATMKEPLLRVLVKTSTQQKRKQEIDKIIDIYRQARNTNGN